MLDKKCFLLDCKATVGDCKNPQCGCLVCLGKNRKSCDLIYNDHKAKIQQTICNVCQNHNCK